MKKTILMIGMMVLLLLIPIMAEQQTLGTFKQDGCVELIQICADCSYVNFTSVKYPDSSLVLDNAVATKDGTEFTYTLCNTTKIGQYIVNGVGDVSGTDTVFSYDFYIEREGQSNDRYIFFILMGLASILFILGLSKEDQWLINFGGLLYMLTGVYILMYGFVSQHNLLTDVIGSIIVGLGIYILLRANIENMNVDSFS